MLDVTFLFNKSNPYGIMKDVQGMSAALTGLSQCRLRYADPLEIPVKSDVLIHVEIPIYTWMPWATKNILVVNPEWFQEAWLPYMGRFSIVIYKDILSAQEAIDKGYVTEAQVRIVPWGCAKPEPPKRNSTGIVPKGTADTGFVWFLAGSASKRAYVPKMLRMWREQYPPLRIYSVDPVDLSGVSVPPKDRKSVV